MTGFEVAVSGKPRGGSSCPAGQAWAETVRAPSSGPGGMAAAARRAGASLAVLLLAVLLAGPCVSPAQAQSGRVLVSNFDQPTNDNDSFYQLYGGLVVAQEFTVEADEDYALTDVTINVALMGTSGEASVAIHEANGSNPAAAALYALTTPSSFPGFGSGNYTFTAPAGATLEKGQSYFVVINGQIEDPNLGVGVFDIKTIISDDEDSDGISGWSIANVGRHHNGVRWANLNFSRSVKMRLHGTVASLSATLSSPTSFLKRSLFYRFDVNLNAAVAIPYREMRDHAFSVTNGHMTGAKRIHKEHRTEDGRQRTYSNHWQMTVVADDETKPVTVTLRGDRACGEQGALCVGNIPLAGTPALTLRRNSAPFDDSNLPRVSIANVRAPENQDVLDFEITRAGPKASRIAVDYRTVSGGTATANTDYHQVETTTVYIRPGQSKVVAPVALISDSVSENNETVKVEISNARVVTDRGTEFTQHPLDIARAVATGTITAPETNTTNVSNVNLRIADTSMRERDGFMHFTVTLSRALEDNLCYGFETLTTGTADEGVDFAQRPKSTQWQPAGVTEWTEFVYIFDDSVNDAGETVNVRISDAGLCDDASKTVSIGRADATGTITNDDPVPDAWLARFGRSVAESHVDAVRDRIGADRSPGLSARFAGQPLPGPEPQAGFQQAAGADGTGSLPDSPAGSRFASLAAPAEGTVLALHANAVPDLEGDRARTPDDLAEDGTLAFRSFLAGDGKRQDGQETRALAADDVLQGTSFAMMRDTGTGLSHGIWGRASRAGFSGREDGTALDGEVTGVMLGTDWKRKGALFGIILSRSEGTGTYSGASSGGIDASLTALVPWAGRELGDGLSVWGALGIGRGDMTLTPDGEDPLDAGLGWTMAAAGAEGALVPGERLGGADLGWHADALWTRTNSDAVRSDAGHLAAGSGAATRLRLGLKAVWERTLASGATLGPRLEAGLRHDGGDAETGFGLEIGGGVGFSDPARGLSVSLDGRTLALHEDGAFGSWGLGLGLSWDPRPETRRGWSLAARQSLGGASSGGVDALLGPEAFPGLPGTEGGGGWSIEAAYGTGESRQNF